MRRLSMALLPLVLGCDLVSVFILAPENMNTVIGGISDTRPYYGRVAMGGVASGQGDLLIASCGCGDWRVLLRSDDGTQQSQFAVRFYTPDEYAQTGSVTIYGDEPAGAMLGTVDQDTGLATGLVRHGVFQSSFQMTRGDNHVDSANACAMCHTGEKPVWPQPENHPAFELNPANCLDCHSVN